MVVMMPTTREAIIKRRFRGGSTNEVETLISSIQVRSSLIARYPARKSSNFKYSSWVIFTGWRFLAAAFAWPKYQRERVHRSTE